MTHRSHIVVALFLTMLLCAAMEPGKLRAQTVPNGFVIENAFGTNVFDLPVQVVFLPGGRKFVVEKGGKVWVMLSNGTRVSTPFIDLSLKALEDRDRGLLGVAIDPDFTVIPWVYFLYVVDPDSDGNDDAISAFSRVERYQASAANPNVADLTSRQILIGGSWSTGIPDVAIDGSHVIGTLRFGEDKTLFIGSGDAARYSNTDAGGFSGELSAFGAGKTPTSQNIGAFRSQTLNSYNGKILRVDKETGLGVPSNPYYVSGHPDSVRSRVWVYGLRNLFRFALRPGTGNSNPAAGDPGTLFIGDVGYNTYEELNIARSGGLNFGWPVREGPSATGGYSTVSATYYPNPNVLATSSPSYENPAPRRNPDLWWHHATGSSSFPSGWTGSCSVGGTFYTGASYPTRYRNSFLIADYGNSWIRSVRFNANDSLVTGSDTVLVSNAQGPVCVEMDTISGDIYYVAINVSKVFRIRYPSGNRNPVIAASVSPSYGFGPLMVNVSASASDPDGDPISYKWRFGNGDSAVVASTSYTYNANGVYNVTVTASDNKNGSDQAAFTVVVGQNAPAAVVSQPADSSSYSSGVTVVLAATQVDTTQGPATYRWDIDLMHEQHIHPSSSILFGRVNSFVLLIPDDGSRYAYRVRLSVTQGALTSSDTALVFGPSGALPIQLVSFTAFLVNANAVRLDWSTLTEINNYGFDVQRSAPSPDSYLTLLNSFVPGHGTTNVPQQYSFTDMSPVAGRQYYRLKQTDLDGSVHFTDGVQVDVLSGVDPVGPVPSVYGLAQNYPNPFNPTTLIRFSIPEQSRVRLEIFNILGERVAILAEGIRPPGNYSAEWDATGVASGLYFYRLQAGDFIDTKKIILLR